MENKVRVLFVCLHNSARSQMAEAFLNSMYGDLFEAHSAGLDPRDLNPVAVEVMKEVLIDISNNKAKDVFEMFKQGLRFDYVITVCDDMNAQRCPIFPGIVNRLYWSFDDPAALTGSHEEKLQGTRKIRDAILEKVGSFKIVVTPR